MTANFFGWQLLYELIKNDLQKDADILVAIAHWQLVKTGKLSCLGIGDDKTFDDAEKGVEMLPTGWNADEKSYTLRYRSADQLYILLGTISEQTLIINLMSAKKLDLSNAVFDVADTVKCRTGSLTEIVPNYPTVIERIRKELFNKEIGKIDSTETQTAAVLDLPPILRDRPIIVEQPDADLYRIPTARFEDMVGRGDLDPLGRGGGGMLFNPPRGGFELPPDGPAIGRPPGARFDPFRPPGADPLRAERRPNRGDHFHPPGYYDDMFM